MANQLHSSSSSFSSTMSRYQLQNVPRVDDLSLDVSDDVLRGLHHKEPSEASSSNSGYSPYTYPIEIKQSSMPFNSLLNLCFTFTR